MHSNSPKEVTIILKFEDKTMREKFLIYDEFKVSTSDLTIANCIDQAKKSFIYAPEEIRVKINFELQN
jgi:hypothetical protein